MLAQSRGDIATPPPLYPPPPLQLGGVYVSLLLTSAKWEWQLEKLYLQFGVKL